MLTNNWCKHHQHICPELYSVGLHVVSQSHITAGVCGCFPPHKTLCGDKHSQLVHDFTGHLLCAINTLYH